MSVMVMDVLAVLVVVAERIVMVGVGVRADRHRVVKMRVVSVVVHVRVVVVERRVRVRVLVTLGHVKPHADGHQGGRQSRQRAAGGNELEGRIGAARHACVLHFIHAEAMPHAIIAGRDAFNGGFLESLVLRRMHHRLFSFHLGKGL